jgi:hypothetical protein
MASWMAAELFGYESFETYTRFITPAAADFRFEGMNASIVGFWFRLFVKPISGPAEENVPIANTPIVAYAGTLFSIVFIVGFYLYARFRTQGNTVSDREDLLFGAGTVAMLLVSPITWDHYLLILVLPLGIVWRELTLRRIRRCGLAVIFLGLMFPTSLVDWFWYAQVRSRNAIEPTAWVLRPFESVFIFSVPTYAMVGLFAYCVWLALTHAASTPAAEVSPSEGAPRGTPPRTPVPSGPKTAR